MNIERLETAVKEATRFLGKVKELRDNAIKTDEDEIFPGKYIESGRHTGAVKRSSMDLTRALADLRRPDSE